LESGIRNQDIDVLRHRSKSMLTYMRKKSVSVDRIGNNTLAVHGVLDDDIYSLELDLTIGLENLNILDFTGRWNRWTTHECPRALMFLKEAVGLKIEEPGFSDTVHRVVGRKACRHFANLLLECCEAAREAALILKWEESKKKEGDKKFEDFVCREQEKKRFAEAISPSAVKTENNEAHPCKIQRTAHGKTGLFIVDLHIHTHPASPCSSVSIEKVVRKAKAIGLDAICLTDHNYLWERKAVEAVKESYDFLILRGNEITTDQGDVLVFGLEKNIRGIIRIEELRDEVLRAGGAMVAAHPFRGFLTFGVGQLGLTPQQAMERPIFRYIDAVEVLNGKVTDRENSFASDVASGIGLPGTGGSDAHEEGEIGIFATGLLQPIQDERDLIEAIRNGQLGPVDLRKER